MLNVKNLYKKYDETVAVSNIDFVIEPGEITVLLGPNGAGKSTTIKSVIGLLKHGGTVTIDGKHNKSVEAKRLFGYVPETPALYDLLTIEEHMQFIASAYGLKDYKERSEELLKRFDLFDKKDKTGKELSKGMQQKVSLCCAFLIEPKLILFDEPMIGLDPKAIKELKNIIYEFKTKGCAILISTHIIDSIEEIWDKTLIMNKGEIAGMVKKDEFKDSSQTLEDLFFKLTGDELSYDMENEK
jgi:ABC-2 type transport system ATP-binding protein